MKYKVEKLTVLILLLLLPFFLRGAELTPVTGANDPPGPNPILFLHGMSDNMGAWGWILQKMFYEDGWQNATVSTPHYEYNFPNSSSCAAQANIVNANHIKQWVETILDETGADKVDLVAHSMGGWSSRYYLKSLGGTEYVDDFVSLGTPHAYDPWSVTNCDGFSDFMFGLNDGDASPGGILNDTLGERVDPMNTSIVYSGAHVSGNVNYTSIYSREDEYVPYKCSYLDGAHNIEVRDLTHMQLLNDRTVYNLIIAALDDRVRTSASSSDFLYLFSSFFVLVIFFRKRTR